MSDPHPQPSGSSSHGTSSSGPNSDAHSSRPNYVTVGTGSISSSAAALSNLLDTDSGYGGSIAGDGFGGSSRGNGWHPGLTEDRPTPSHTPVLPGESNPASENERRVLAGHVLQLYYNQNRVALARAIGRTVETLKELQQMNATWPAHYPSVQRSDILQNGQRSEARPGISHTQSSLADLDREDHGLTPSRPGGLRRAFTAGAEEGMGGESSSQMEKPAVPEPRLMTPQLAQEFSILKLDLKLGALSQSELVHSLEKSSIASLLDGKIRETIQHLFKLRDRIEDTSSKVLVTGDVNAGKSTFCNALLRRKVLPEDQQPCTSIFCEVLDARENGGIEEVHAIHKEAIYSRNDESTYDVFKLKDLDKIVLDNDRYTQAKVYVKDIRSIDESLLNNGVVDISIIDAPGLNMDSLKTHAVFARQEEIDVVVFVVSAANHFTLSAKEFLLNAAREKAYIFIVVNGFDNIKDQERCQKVILQQVAALSPRTRKEASELVHFVSSNAIPMPPGSVSGGGGDGGEGSSGSGSGSGSGPSDDDKPDDGDGGKKDKGKQKEKIQDFEELEQSLRRFVLEKRARSKLAPAKTFLLQILGDLNNLATINRDVAQSEYDKVTKELEDIEPALEKSRKARAEVSDDIDRTIEGTCSEIYTHTRTSLASSIAHVSEADLGVPYAGITHAFQFAEDLKKAMLAEISSAVSRCEADARERTVQGVSSIKALGLLHLGDEYTDMAFRSDIMFKRKRDALARQVDTDVVVWDFFDVAGLLQRQEKVAGTGMAMTVVGVLGGRLVGGVGWMDGALGAVKILGAKNLRQLVVPGMVVAVIAATTYVLASIPQTLPRRLSSKLAASLASLDYTHANALRISGEVRKVLRFPADDLRVGLQRSVEKLGQRRQDTGRLRDESGVARKYFANLCRDSRELGNAVDAVDLEGPAPGVAGGYDG